MTSARLLVAGSIVIYSAGFMLWYSVTPLGLYPVLDGREMLALARAMASGELAREPFYRAPLYSGVLSLALRSGLDSADLPLFARMLNLVLHWLSAMLVWQISMQTWHRTTAAALATLIVGITKRLKWVSNSISK